MMSMRSEEEAEVYELVALPWPHLIVDDFLSSSVLKQSMLEINAETYEFESEKRGSGRIEFALLKSETLWRAIYSKRTVSLLSRAFGARVRLNKHNWVQLRHGHTPEFPLHNDFASKEDTIASFLYLSSGWSSKCGGRLRLSELSWRSADS